MWPPPTRSDVMPAARFFLLFCLASAVARAQETDANRLVEQLAFLQLHNAARERLVELGTSAVAPLPARIITARADHACACLDVLGELGPAGGAAVPVLVDLLRDRRRDPEIRAALAETLAELIPYRGAGIEVTSADLAAIGLGAGRADGSGS